MNKKLTASEALRDLKDGYTLTYMGLAVSFTKDFFDEKINIIEKELKAYKHINKRLKNKLFEYEDKEIKALDIIKEKSVDVRFLFQCKNLKDYNYIYEGTSESNLCLTKKEYDLLKEVLSDAK